MRPTQHRAGIPAATKPMLHYPGPACTLLAPERDTAVFPDPHCRDTNDLALHDRGLALLVLQDSEACKGEM